MDGQEYIPSYPPYYSIDGDGTKEAVLKQENDPNCPETDTYRWYESSDYICVGDDKHKKEYYQISYDNGLTWQNVVPEVTRAGELINQHSSDCTNSYENKYLTLVAEADLVIYSYLDIREGSVGANPYAMFSYSVDDGETWEIISYSEVNQCSTYSELIPKGTKVLLRNLHTTIWGGASRILATSFFHLEGNVMSLIYGDNFIGKRECRYFRALTSVFKGNIFLTNIDNLILPATSLSSLCYQSMFEGCTSLTNVPINLLPATDLTPTDNYSTSSCYSNMFAHCTSLRNVPRLPATTLSKNCYGSMFMGCTSLTNVPSDLLPATALTENCYAYMFTSCTSLTNVPKLPAKLLAPGCYYNMFGGVRDISYYSGCTSLTNVPSDLLPATSLMGGCYEGMFYGCTSLTSAPVLPAEILTERCYYQMFGNCESLNSITCLATDISASGCTSAWTENVSTTGIFTKNTNMDNWTTGVDGIPSGWVINNQSSEPPVTSMKFRGIYSGGSTSEINCNGDSVLHYSEISGLTGSFTGITSGEIGDCVATIGDAFYSATTLTSVTISDSVHKINPGSFEYCYRLSEITIPDNVVYIGWNAFEKCWHLRTIIIGSGINQIANYAFYQCSGLTSITVEATIPPILGDSVFGYTNNCPIYVPCESVNAYKTADVWSNYASRIQAIPGSCASSTKWFATYSGGTTSSAECDSTSAITENEITKINLESVDIGNCVTNIENNAFSGYSSLTSVIIGSGVTSIGNSAFNSCSSLTSVTIPSGVTSIGASAFQWCSGLTSVTIPSGVTSIGNMAFEYCSNLTGISIPNTVTYIGGSAFEGCSGITSINIPSGVTSIRNWTFAYCKSLSSCTIGNGVTSIGYASYYQCSGLTIIEIPDSVTSIDDYAFRGCSGLTSCTIGSGATSIGNYAFWGCSSLTSITVNATTPPSLGSNVFGNTNNCPIYVPCESVNTYKAASGWSTYASRIEAIPGSCPFAGKWLATYTGGTTSSAECDSTSAITQNEITLTDLASVEIGDCVTSIGNNAFSGYSSLTSVIIGSGVTSIGNSAFNSCSSLTSVTIPSGVTSIPDTVFYYCTRLTSVTIPDTVTSIGNRSFYLCTSLSAVTIPDTVTSIGISAFWNCTGLASVIIPSGVTSIPDTVFYYCTRLTSVTIPDTVTSIGDSAFMGCSSLTSVIIPSSVTRLKYGAFYDCTGLTSITINATTPPTLGGYVFDNTNNCPIYVPAASVSTYQSASGWSTYASRIQAIP